MDADAPWHWPPADGGEGGVDDVGEVEPLDVEAELAGDDAGDVEQVLDDLGLGPGIPLDGGEALLDVVGIDLAGAEDLGPAEDGVERGAQLVGERGQEFVLHAVGRFGLGPGRLGGGEQPLPLRLGLLASVMSRAIFAAPTIVPSASRIGETLSETSMTRPSFATPLGLEVLDPLAAADVVQDSAMSSAWSGGIRMEMGLPTISAAV